MERSKLVKKEIQAASVYAKRHEKQLEELADQFDNMGNLGLFWDSKVPDKDKSLFYFFTIGFTDPEDVKAEIDKYQKFYRDLSVLTSKIGSDDSDENKLIQDLRKHLAELRRTAEAGEKTTGSSAVYDLHREFVDKHEKLEHIIKRIECETVNERRNQLKETSNRQERELDKSNDMIKTVCDRYDQLSAKHREETKVLERENDSLREQNQKLSETYNQRQEQLETLQQKNERQERVIQELTETNNNREKQLETLQQKSEGLERLIQEMRERRQELFDNNTVLMNLLKTFAER